MSDRSEAPVLLGPGEIRDLAATLGIRPTKQRGQNFVTDPNTIRRIVRVAGVGADDVVLEIGPGLGSLTLGLLGAARRVVAVELDHGLAAGLTGIVEARVPDGTARLDVVEGDAVRLTGLPGPAPTVLVANLPYNVAVPALLNVLERFDSIGHGLVMVQQEVADRLTAEPGSKTYGIPTVKAAWYCSMRSAGSVGRSVFWPQPNVDSGLVAFARTAPPKTMVAAGRVFAVIDAAFASRRKTLRAALAGWAGGPVAAERVLKEAGIDPSTRGERLGIGEFTRIAEALDRVNA